jgi:serine/threonine-protein kinase
MKKRNSLLGERLVDPEAPVEKPEDFVGQHGLIRRVFSRIGAERPQSVAIIGGPKSGKTSLMNYLSHLTVSAQYLDKPERYIFLSFCGDSNITVDPGEFLFQFEQQLPRSTASGSNDYERIGKQVEKLHFQNRRLILLMDDFHYITSNQQFPLEFFSFLRSMANIYNLAYVTTSLLELQKLCAMKEVEESPFFNIFTYMHLGMLTQEDAVSLFVKISGCNEAAAEEVVRWCGGSPYLLKKTAHVIAADIDQNHYKGKDLLNRVFKEFIGYFEHVVSLLPPEGLKPLQAVKRGRVPSPTQGYHLNSLIKQGFLVEKEDGITSSSPAFAFFLKKHLSARLFRSG